MKKIISNIFGVEFSFGRRRRIWGALLACAFLSLAGHMPNAFAQKIIEGVISEDAHWTAEDGPYVLRGDVTVQNSAKLRIDPGVTIYMDQAASLVVKQGSLYAEGVKDSPIQVVSDKVRQGQIPNKGDWAHWIFEAGATDSHVRELVFRHGSGIHVNGAAPTFDFVQIREQFGAAMTLDLAASPAGVGNLAEGNDVNGILVPSGDIVGRVKWGMQGIPYIVSTGAVSVGETPRIVGVFPSQLQRGESATVNVIGTGLKGLAGAEFGYSGIRAQPLSGVSDTQAALSVSVDSDARLGVTDLELLVDAGWARGFNVFTVVQVQPIVEGMEPAYVYYGQGPSILKINGRNFTDRSTVLINGSEVSSSYISSTQIQVEVPARDGVDEFAVQLKTPDPLESGEYLFSNEVSLPIRSAQISVSPQTLSLYAEGSSKALSVELPFLAPEGGLDLELKSSSPDVVDVPAVLQIAKGQSSASVALKGKTIGSAIVTVSKQGFSSGQSNVSVARLPALSLVSASSSVGVDRAMTIALRSSIPAGVLGQRVKLISSDEAVVNVPAEVMIPAGASEVSFKATGTALGEATIRAEATDYVQASRIITVRPLSLSLPANVRVTPGMTRTIDIALSDPAPQGGLHISLSSNDSAVASVLASIVVPEGQSHGTFDITGTTEGSTDVVVTASGHSPVTMPVTVEIIQLVIGKPGVSKVFLLRNRERQLDVMLSKPAPTGGLTISFEIADPEKVTINLVEIRVKEGETVGASSLVKLLGVANGETSLVASAAGLDSVVLPIEISEKQKIMFYTSDRTVGKWLMPWYNVVFLGFDDRTFYLLDEPLTVTLTPSDSSKVQVPRSVIIPAGSNSIAFDVVAMEETGGTPVVIDAAADGYDAPKQKLEFDVVTPMVVLEYWGDEQRGTFEDTDRVRPYVSMPNGSLRAGVDIPIDLSIVDGNPADIVEGFSLDGVPVKQAVMKKGELYSTEVSVGLPTAEGVYKVQASVPGIGSATSKEVTVTGPTINFGWDVSVGKGFEEHWAFVGVGADVAEDLIIQLAASDPSKIQIPASVTIPKGESGIYFTIRGLELTGDAPVTIDASARRYHSPVKKLLVSVVKPVIELSVSGGNSSLGKVCTTTADAGVVG